MHLQLSWGYSKFYCSHNNIYIFYLTSNQTNTWKNKCSNITIVSKKVKCAWTPLTLFNIYLREWHVKHATYKQLKFLSRTLYQCFSKCNFYLTSIKIIWCAHENGCSQSLFPETQGVEPMVLHFYYTKYIMLKCYTLKFWNHWLQGLNLIQNIQISSFIYLKNSYLMTQIAKY